jgi:hypothetical protein
MMMSILTLTAVGFFAPVLQVRTCTRPAFAIAMAAADEQTQKTEPSVDIVAEEVASWPEMMDSPSSPTLDKAMRSLSSKAEPVNTPQDDDAQDWASKVDWLSATVWPVPEEMKGAQADEASMADTSSQEADTSIQEAMLAAQAVISLGLEQTVKALSPSVKAGAEKAMAALDAAYTESLVQRLTAAEAHVVISSSIQAGTPITTRQVSALLSSRKASKRNK